MAIRESNDEHHAGSQSSEEVNVTRRRRRKAINDEDDDNVDNPAAVNERRKVDDATRLTLNAEKLSVNEYKELVELLSSNHPFIFGSCLCFERSLFTQSNS
jgi:hypothetical protein